MLSFFSPPENRAVCDNVGKFGRARQVTDGNIIWSMRFACRITKATDTYLEYVILIAFPQQRLAIRTCLNIELICKLRVFLYLAKYVGLYCSETELRRRTKI